MTFLLGMSMRVWYNGEKRQKSLGRPAGQPQMKKTGEKSEKDLTVNRIYSVR